MAAGGENIASPRRLFSSRGKDSRLPKGGFEGAVIHINTNEWKGEENKRSREDGAMIMFYAPWCEMSKLSQPIYSAFADELLKKNQQQTEILSPLPSAIAVNCELEKALCQEEAIDGYPTFMFYKNKIGIEFEGRVTVTRLSKFVASKMGSTKPKEKSSNEDVTSMNLNLPAWGTKENSGKVVKITNDNFGSRRDPRSSLFLMFYAPWCTHCTEVKPTFALASTGGNAGKDVDFKGTVFGAVDCDMEEQLCQDFNIQKFPTFAYMPGNVKDVVPDEYDGERDAEEMVDFVLSKLIGANVPDSFFEEA